MATEDLSFMFKRSINGCIAMYNKGEKGRAFREISSFRIQALTKDDKKILSVAGEMMTGKGSFYTQLGFVQADMEQKADVIFRRHFIDKESK